MLQLRLTPAVKFLLIACVGTFLVQQTADQFLGGHLLEWLALIPSAFVGEFRVWQLLTYSFLHGDVMHLVLNMLMLVFVGSELEGLWGTRRFVRYYLICVLTGGVFYLLMQLGIWRGLGLSTPLVGASGGIYGLLMAYGILFGERVLLFMMLFPMKAKHFIWVLIGVEFFSSIFSGRGGLGSVAHLGGMVGGFAALWGRAAFQAAQRRRGQGAERARSKPKRKSGSHLKLIINNERPGEDGGDDADSGPKTWH